MGVCCFGREILLSKIAGMEGKERFIAIIVCSRNKVRCIQTVSCILGLYFTT